MRHGKGLIWALVAIAAAVALAVGLTRLTGDPPAATPSPGVIALPSPSASAVPEASPAFPSPVPSPTEEPVVAPTEDAPATALPTASQATAATPVPSPEPTPTPAPADPSPQPEADTCTLSIQCRTVLDNRSLLDPDKAELIPADGVLLPPTATAIEPGDSAFDLLARLCRETGIHLEFSMTPGYGSAYIEGIGNLYEFDCGPRSGWLYRVNGQTPDRGCSDYTLSPGDRVEFLYSCQWGEDLA